MPSRVLVNAPVSIFLSLFLLPALLLAAPSTPERAKKEWKDAKGTVIPGEPAEIVGPLVFFRTAKVDQPRRIRLSAFSEEDCQHLYQITGARAKPSASWETATGSLTRAIARKIIPANPHPDKPTPEPEMLILIFGYQSGKHPVDSLLFNLVPFMERLERVYPGKVSILFWGDEMPGGWFAKSRRLGNWFGLTPGNTKSVPEIPKLAPPGILSLALTTREGMPLIRQELGNIQDVAKFCDNTANLLWLLNPENPQTSADWAHYLKAVRPLQFADNRTGPRLLYSRLNLDTFRKHNVFSINARLSIDQTGAVTEVEYLEGTLMPQKIQEQLTPVLKKALHFLPAVDQGKPVPDTYLYQIETNTKNSPKDNEDEWVKGTAIRDHPLQNWLVLQSIYVPTMTVTGTTTTKEDGTLQLGTVSIGAKVSKTSQLNAFNSNWFDEAGAGSVQPKAGDVQVVDGETYKWSRIKTDLGYYDLGQDRACDHSIAYVWTEIDSTEETDAWLGLGSDDGIKAWFNGELVVDHFGVRFSVLDDNVAKVRLLKGKNTILLKVQNVEDRWTFIARLRLRSN